mgnify:CR=1 FL=1
MTNDNNPETTYQAQYPLGPARSFVPVLLPWVIGAIALLVYGLTLNPWVSLNSLGLVGRTCGWSWQPELSGPLYWVVTYPFRWLPIKAIPLALNLFSCLCAALTLVLLARSVALLPHDRTEEQRIREKSTFSTLSIRSAWLPPVLAALVCGLQLTFWEHATAASQDMFDLLLFAYVIRCLLEFRIDGRQSWLSRAAFLYAAAMTNNWAMLGFFPLFLIAVAWVKGLSFFNLRFLLRMFLWGLAGLCFYFVLPLAAALSDHAQFTFWQALRLQVAQEKNLLFSLLNKQVLFNPQTPWWVLGLPSLLPVLIIAIRWPSYFGDPSRLGIAVSTFVYHVFHGVLLLYTVWIALDPVLSPRSYGIAGLPLYYLGAICIGYFAGYFLLVFGTKPFGRPRPVPRFVPLVRGAVFAAMWAVAAGAAAALVYLNLPQIRATNGPMLADYTESLIRALPAQPAVVLSDDVWKPWLVESRMAWTGKEKTHLLLHASSINPGLFPESLRIPAYNRFLKRYYGERWPLDPDQDKLDLYDQATLARLMAALAKTNQLCYLNPSFGYYFELLYPEPHGMVQYLRLCPTNSLLLPPLSEAVLQSNAAFWSQAEATLLPPVLNAIVPPKATNGFGAALAKIRATPKPIPSGRWLAQEYSRNLNAWGVVLQRHGRLVEAQSAFQRAFDLNPDNVVAEVNLQCNQNLQAGRTSSVRRSKSIEDQFEKYRSWEGIMLPNGPFDEPTICFQQAYVFFRGSNFRQAAQQFDRVRQLDPDNSQANLELAKILILSGMVEEALKELEPLHNRPEVLQGTNSLRMQLLFLEMAAHLARNDVATADGKAKAALKVTPDHEEVLSAASQAFLTFRCYSNALEYIEQRLRLKPDAPGLLLDKGYAYLQLNQLVHAIPPLNRALALEKNPASPIHLTALYNRALAYLRSEQYDLARRDYETLQKQFPTDPNVHYGLGEVAYHRKDYKTAITHYELFLANSPTNTPEATNILARLNDLRSSR